MTNRIYYVEENWYGEIFTGYRYEGGVGLFDSYISTMADSMGLWEDYCEYHRGRR